MRQSPLKAHHLGYTPCRTSRFQGIYALAGQKARAVPPKPPWRHCRAVRTGAGAGPGWLVRQGLMSSPPRRV